MSSSGRCSGCLLLSFFYCRRISSAALPVATIYKFGHGVRVDNARATAAYKIGAEGGDAECASFSSAWCVAAAVVVGYCA
mmetsp:Transcript_63536/g.175183  ORF Transcript_63536/g.175183 Transcript_63536/m.175183 type:complete len:80 (-) Transcript_63536:536-775(-)